MEKCKCSTFKVCAIIVTIMVVFITGLTTAVVKKGITIKGDFGTVANGTPVSEDNGVIAPSETEIVLETVTDESGEAVTNASGEAVTSVVEKVVTPTSATVQENSEKSKAIEIYNTAAKKVKDTAKTPGTISLKKTQATKLENFDLTGKSAVDSFISIGFTASNGTKEFDKGSDEIIRRLPPDGGKYVETRANLKSSDVSSATCTLADGVYNIKINFAPATDPVSSSTSGIGTVATVLMKQEFVDVFNDEDNKFILSMVGAKAGDLNVDNFSLIHNGYLEAKVDEATGNLTYIHFFLDITPKGSILFKGEENAIPSDAKITREETHVISWN